MNPLVKQRGSRRTEHRFYGEMEADIRTRNYIREDKCFVNMYSKSIDKTSKHKANSGAPERSAVPAPGVVHLDLLLLKTRYSFQTSSNSRNKRIVFIFQFQYIYYFSSFTSLCIFLIESVPITTKVVSSNPAPCNETLIHRMLSDYYLLFIS